MDEITAEPEYVDAPSVESRRPSVPTKVLTRTASFARSTSSVVPPPVITDLADASTGQGGATVDLEHIRGSATQLAGDPNIDKESALRIMKVFHDMERLLHTECVNRDRKLAEAQFQFEKVKLEMEMLQNALERPTTPPVAEQLFEPPPAPVKRGRRGWGNSS